MLSSGEIIGGRYIVEHVIAKGGMGCVYRVRDVRLNRRSWAVKEIMSDQMNSESMMDEVRILSDLSHPYIPKVVDYFESDDAGRCYLVMELVNGRTLLDLYAEKDPFLTIEQTLKYAVQVCEILCYLHEQPKPIIFRDLKPANIMVDEYDNLKLIDFGIARNYKQGQVNDTVAFGTIAFAAPEQLENRQTDARSDLYALGATLYFLVTGGLYYYQARSTVDALPVSLPRELTDVIKKLLDSDPKLRFQSAREVKQHLSAIATRYVTEPTPKSEPTVRIYGSGDHLSFAASPADGTMSRRKPYSIQATQTTPALLIYLIDVSASMEMEMEGRRRIDVVRTALISAIKQMVFRSTKGSRIAARYRLAILAYSEEVYDLLGGVKSIDEVARTGALPELTPRRFTDSALAFKRAEEILRNELPQMAGCPAPIICHMTDGAHTGDDPEPIARRIMEMSVPDGHVLIENIFISDDILQEPIREVKRWRGITADATLKDDYAVKLRNMSSVLPDSYRTMMSEFSYALQDGAVMMLPGSSPELVSLGFQMSAATPIR